MQIIDSFTGYYDFLSNFYMHDFLYNGNKYSSVEHAFQSLKTLDKNERDQIIKSKTPSQAKRLGRACTLRSDWESIKLQIMENLIIAKFSDQELKNKLILTWPHELVEGNWWGDTFWGVCKNKGRNHLGKILMTVRKEFKDASLSFPH